MYDFLYILCFAAFVPIRSLAFCKMAYVMSYCLRSKILNRYSQQNTRFHSLPGLNGVRSSTRILFCQRSRHYAGGISGPMPGQTELQGEDTEERTETGRKQTRSNWNPTLSKMFESAATTLASILVLGLAGYGYHRVCRFLKQGVFWTIFRPASHDPVAEGTSFSFELSHCLNLFAVEEGC